MSAKIEFFYDYVSVFFYLADSQLGSLAGAEVVYRPMFLGAVMEATGNRPPGTVKAKGRYLRADIERWAKRYSFARLSHDEVEVISDASPMAMFTSPEAWAPRWLNA